MSKKNRHPISNTLVDIAILTAGIIEPSVFEKCLSACFQESHTAASKIYLFRDGVPAETKDAYSEILKRYPVSVSQQSDNKGYPYGANRAIKSGTSPLVLFVSDDVILHEGTLQKLVRRMDDPSIGMCGLKLIFPEDSIDVGRPAGKVQHVGHGVDVRGEVTHPLLGWRPGHPKCNISRDVISVTGAAFMVRRKTFIQAGGFWEGYGKGYFEDVDLCLEIRKLNQRVFIDTEATATHYTGATFIKKNDPMPLEHNKMIFRQRKGNLLTHTSWEFW